MTLPALGRSVSLAFRGDWGLANFHRICGWLCQTFCERAGPHSRVAIWNGAGGMDNIRAVGRGEVDLAIATPVSFAPAALTGGGIFHGEAYPDLRALAVLPQYDVMVFALPEELGIRSFAELHTRKPRLRIAVAPNDGINFLGLGGQRLLAAAGLSREVIESWGGEYVELLTPWACLEAVKTGAADAVVQEAIMGPWWREAMAAKPLRLLSLEENALASLESLGWSRRTLPARYFASQADPVVTLDFADFLVFVRADMPEDVAWLLTWCLIETRHLIEQQYRHIKPEWSPLTYPLDPKKMAASPVPLHPGSMRYFSESGVL